MSIPPPPPPKHSAMAPEEGSPSEDERLNLAQQPPDDEDSAEWIPDEWIPGTPSTPSPLSTPPAKDQPAKDQPAKDSIFGNNQLSNKLTPSQPDSAPDSAKPVQKAKKHSAELFPIPPASSSPSPPSLNDAASEPNASRQVVGPLPLVETAFLASAASLMWLINSYFPPGPLLRILFPLPIALVYLRWNLRAAWMAATVSGLLLTILLGPTRSIFFVMPYALLGVQLGCLWRRRASWELSIFTGGVLVALGTFFRLWLLSLLAGEDLWGYLIAQITQFIDWIVRLLTNWGWIGLGAWGQPSMEMIAIAAIIIVLFSSMVYLFTVHLAAWLLLERLGVTMPEPPGWVQALIED